MFSLLLKDLISDFIFDAFINISADTEDTQSSSVYDKFDVSNIPQTFLSSPDILQRVNSAIFAFESSLRLQNGVDLVYDDWCRITREQIYSEVPFKSKKNGN